MFMRSISLILLILSLTNCKTTSIPAQDNMQTRTAGSFTHVQVEGDIDVTLYTGDAKRRVILHGNQQGFPFVEININNGLLQVTKRKAPGSIGRVSVEIPVRYITSFTYKGTGTITGKNLQSGWLDLSIHNKGNTTLDGKIKLHRLDVSGSGRSRITGITGSLNQIKTSGNARVQLGGEMHITSLHASGNSWISLYWVQGDVLRVRAKNNAFIQIAGTANTLDVALKDHARFNGRYMRGTDVFVKTFDHAVADISAVKTQHTLASDTSNIYFHHLPDMKADFMACDGSVLDMREWELPNLQEYTRYNR